MLSEDAVTEQLGRSITTALNVHGWHHLDAILLASLATEFPLLLIGPHGTAKTILVERIANALNRSFRHYNASLLNYDDLVGIPMPEDGQEFLRFITTPGAIWDAEFVFFDEISRCRPDLQNKLFPIIHEKRVVGMPLQHLRYRWAAMNPPSPDNPDLDPNAGEFYLGSEPLDPALTDRFPFVVPVPSWRDLSREDRRQLLALDVDPNRNHIMDIFQRPLESLVEECRALLPEVAERYGEWLGDYVIGVVDALGKASLPQSPRRARMLIEGIVAIHAARHVLVGEEPELADSAELALLYGLPQNATDVPPTPASIVAIHRQAWEIASMFDDDVWRQILEEQDPIKRLLLAEELQVSDDDLSRLVTQVLNMDASEARKVGLATAMFLRYRRQHQLTPAAWEPLVQLAGRVLSPRIYSITVNGNTTESQVWGEIKPWVLKHRQGGAVEQLEANYVLGGFPDLWRQQNWADALKQFKEDLNMFGGEELLA